MKTAIAALSLLSCGVVHAQQASASLTYEVASIKPSAPDERRVGIMFQPGGGLRVTNAPLRMVIALAYDVRDFQISGGPGWIGSDRFDINARPEGSAAAPSTPDDFRKFSDEQRKTFQEQQRERLRNLLADRFQLRIHKETKEQSIYALVVAKNGPKLKRAEGGPGPMLRFGGRGQLDANGVEMGIFGNTLSNVVGRQVVDKTGLTGKYDLKLTWTPDPGEGGFLGGPPLPGVSPPPADPGGPSLFTALQEQLGLRLESQKGPGEVLVIDSVEKPSEN